MGGACEGDHARRWTSARLIPLVFVAALLVVSVAGLVARSRASGVGTPGRCAAVADVAVRYQTAVTRDLGRHARLHADTGRLVAELRSLRAEGCRETRRFLAAAEETIGELCRDCVVDLRSARAPGP